jgi:hypothetical protein
MKIKKERWKTIPGWPRYEVSTTGLVRCANSYHKSKNGKLLNSKVDKFGYRVCDLWDSGTTKRVRVHVLVMLAFVGPRPEGMDIRHLNGIRTDNRLHNLCYGTRSENVQDAIKHGTYVNGFGLAWQRGSFTPEILSKRSLKGWGS